MPPTPQNANAYRHTTTANNNINSNNDNNSDNNDRSNSRWRVDYAADVSVGMSSIEGFEFKTKLGGRNATPGRRAGAPDLVALSAAFRIQQ